MSQHFTDYSRDLQTSDQCNNCMYSSRIFRYCWHYVESVPDLRILFACFRPISIDVIYGMSLLHKDSTSNLPIESTTTAQSKLHHLY